MGAADATLWLRVALWLLPIALIAWRPQMFRAVVAQLMLILDAPLRELHGVFQQIRRALARAVIQCSVADAGDLTGWKIAGHYLHGLLFTICVVIGLLAEWALAAVTFAGMWGLPSELAAQLPFEADTLAAAGLVTAPYIFGAILADAGGVAQFLPWHSTRPWFRYVIVVLAALGILAATAIGIAGGMYRGLDDPAEGAELGSVSFGEDLLLQLEVGRALDELATETTDSTQPEAHPDSEWAWLGGAPARLLYSGGTAGVVFVAIFYAGIALQAFVQIVAAVPAAVGWLLAGIGEVLLQTALAVVNQLYVFLEALIGFIAGIFRRDTRSGAWAQPYEAREANDQSAIQMPRGATPASTVERAPVADEPDDDPNWRGI